MVEEVRRFLDHATIVFLHGGHGGLHRLFAQLLCAMGDAHIDQRTSIGFCGARLGTPVNPLPQTGKCEIAHTRSSITDRAASAGRLWPYIPWLAARCTLRSGR